MAPEQRTRNRDDDGGDAVRQAPRRLAGGMCPRHMVGEIGAEQKGLHDRGKSGVRPIE